MNVKEAVEDVNFNEGKWRNIKLSSRQTLIDLANSFLSAGNGLPAKSRVIPNKPEGHLKICGCAACSFVNHLQEKNDLIDACQLAIARKLKGLEDFLFDWLGKNQAERISKKALAKSLTQAIKNHITQG